MPLVRWFSSLSVLLVVGDPGISLGSGPANGRWGCCWSLISVAAEVNGRRESSAPRISIVAKTNWKRGDGGCSAVSIVAKTKWRGRGGCCCCCCCSPTSVHPAKWRCERTCAVISVEEVKWGKWGGSTGGCTPIGPSPASWTGWEALQTAPRRPPGPRHQG